MKRINNIGIVISLLFTATMAVLSIYYLLFSYSILGFTLSTSLTLLSLCLFGNLELNRLISEVNYMSENVLRRLLKDCVIMKYVLIINIIINVFLLFRGALDVDFIYNRVDSTIAGIHALSILVAVLSKTRMVSSICHIIFIARKRINK